VVPTKQTALRRPLIRDSALGDRTESATPAGSLRPATISNRAAARSHQRVAGMRCHPADCEVPALGPDTRSRSTRRRGGRISDDQAEERAAQAPMLPDFEETRQGWREARRVGLTLRAPTRVGQFSSSSPSSRGPLSGTGRVCIRTCPEREGSTGYGGWQRRMRSSGFWNPPRRSVRRWQPVSHRDRAA
jgi:hypothetical protein